MQQSASDQFDARVKRLMRATGITQIQAIGRVRRAYPKLTRDADAEHKAEARARAGAG